MGSTVKFAALAFAFAATPAFAGDYDCDAHAAHIDAVIGADKALQAYGILHDHKADPEHLVDSLKAEYPAVEKELEDYAAADCSRDFLVSHADD